MSKRKTVDNLFNDVFDNMNTVREDVDGNDKKIIYVHKSCKRWRGSIIKKDSSINPRPRPFGRGRGFFE